MRNEAQDMGRLADGGTKWESCAESVAPIDRARRDGWTAGGRRPRSKPRRGRGLAPVRDGRATRVSEAYGGDEKRPAIYKSRSKPEIFDRSLKKWVWDGGGNGGRAARHPPFHRIEPRSFVLDMRQSHLLSTLRTCGKDGRPKPRSRFKASDRRFDDRTPKSAGQTNKGGASMRNRPSCTKFRAFWPRNRVLARKSAFPNRKSCQAQQNPLVGKIEAGQGTLERARTRFRGQKAQGSAAEPRLMQAASARQARPRRRRKRPRPLGGPSEAPDQNNPGSKLGNTGSHQSWL